MWIGDILKSVDGLDVMHIARNHQDKNLKEAWEMKERQVRGNGKDYPPYSDANSADSAQPPDAMASQLVCSLRMQDADRTMEEAQKRMRGEFATSCTLQLLRLQPSAPPGGPAPASGQGIPPTQALPLYSSASSSAPSVVPVNVAGHGQHMLRQLKCVVQRVCASRSGRRFAVDKSYLV